MYVVVGLVSMCHKILLGEKDLWVCGREEVIGIFGGLSK